MKTYKTEYPPNFANLDADVKRILIWLNKEFRRIEDFSFTSQDLQVIYNEPEITLEGMVRYFGVGGFDPGYGPGPYVYVVRATSEGWRPMFDVSS